LNRRIDVDRASPPWSGRLAMDWTLVLFCSAIVVASVLGGILPLATLLSHTRLQVYLSVAAGTMLGAVFFHMLPEAVEEGGAGVLRWSAGGLLALFFLERFFAFHHHEVPPSHDHAHDHLEGHHTHELPVESAKGSALHWGAAAFGLAAHSLVGGIALASAVAADARNHGTASVGWGVFLATVIHKPADALTIVALMLRAGVPRFWAHAVNLGFSMMIPLGALVFDLGLRGVDPTRAASVTGSALAFSAGTFLCIALSDLLPELQFHAHDRVKLSISLLAGFGLMAIVSLWE
jgi:zinc and cadmium transporter